MKLLKEVMAVLLVSARTLLELGMPILAPIEYMLYRLEKKAE